MADEGATVFQAVIQAVDRVTGPVRGIVDAVKALTGVEEKAGVAEAKMHSKGVQEAHAHGHAFHALSAHIRLLRGHFGNLTATIGEFGSKFSELIPAFAGLGAAGSLVGLFEMTNHAAEAFSTLAATARQAGVSVQTFSALSLAAKENDVPVEQLRSSLFNLSKIMGGALAGSNKKAAVLFAHLGIALKDSHGQALSASQVLPQLADAFEHTKSATMRAVMAQTLFGGRAGAMLLPILMKGKQGLEEYAAAYKKVGYVPTGGAAEGLEAFHSSWVKLTTAVQGFTMEIGAKLAPVLKPIVDLATQWVAKNREWITTNIQGAVSDLVGWIKKLNIHDVVTETESWIGTIRATVSALGGAKIVIGAVGLALGAPLLGAVGSAIEIFGALRNVMLGMATAAMANPLVAIAVAVGVAALVIYENWTPIKAFFERIWAGIKAAVAPVWAWIKSEVMDQFNATAATLQQNWASVRGFFVATWGGVKAAFADAWAYIGPIVTRIQNAVGFVENSWVGRKLGLGSSPGSPGRAGAPGTPGAPARLSLTGPLRGGAAASRLAGAGGATRVHGKVETVLTIKNAPRGTQVETRASGAAAPPQVNLGFAAPAFGMY